ncbi:MAG: FMN-binding negative transcriptional regulator [Alphaproteobacteria bacterium]|nr:FMN-binding negative transcriptional regulator [Alphaproteobacteria bacterium]MDE2112839.1 FMN-binding negative transcriptional regulator [Alphaproteobacteria bacterium]
MYRPKPFVWDDVAAIQRFLRFRSFATVAAVMDGSVSLAYAPVVVDDGEPFGSVRFHLAANNPLADIADSTDVLIAFSGPDAYVSPDWYVSEGFVPTWNYVAVEGRGKTRRLSDDELRILLADLSAEQERKLQPKAPWTIDKVPEAKVEALVRAIRGFSVKLESLEGKLKLSQDKKAEDRQGVIAGLEARGDPFSRAVAIAIQAHPGK